VRRELGPVRRGSRQPRFGPRRGGRGQLPGSARPPSPMRRKRRLQGRPATESYGPLPSLEHRPIRIIMSRKLSSGSPS
jgi:hypothetical protein